MAYCFMYDKAEMEKLDSKKVITMQYWSIIIMLSRPALWNIWLFMVYLYSFSNSLERIMLDFVDIWFWKSSKDKLWN